MKMINIVLAGLQSSSSQGGSIAGPVVDADQAIPLKSIQTQQSLPPAPTTAEAAQPSTLNPSTTIHRVSPNPFAESQSTQRKYSEINGGASSKNNNDNTNGASGHHHPENTSSADYNLFKLKRNRYQRLKRTLLRFYFSSIICDLMAFGVIVGGRVANYFPDEMAMISTAWLW